VPVADPPAGDSDPSAQPPIGELWVEPRTLAAGTVLVVRGEVDMRTAPVLAEHMERHFSADGGRRPLVFDLTAVGFLGSAGLGVLLSARQRAIDADTTIWVVAGSRAVRRPIQVTGLAGILNVVDDLASALAGIG
jgi:anti-sigma B factor antagonist